MSWLTALMDEHTVAWVFLSAVVGGVVGASVKFLFEDLLGHRLARRRAVHEVIRSNTTPLLRAAETLERQINNFVRNRDQGWYSRSEYYRLSTLYAFGEYLGWILIIERGFGFLPYESSRAGKRFNRQLYGLFRALSSFGYFRDASPLVVDASQVPRRMLAAIGEVMVTGGGGEGTDRQRVRLFTDFAVNYGRDEQFCRWFQDLDAFLRRAERRDPLEWDRLIAAGANIRGLIAHLDPKGAMVARRQLSNLPLVINEDLRSELTREFKDLLGPSRERWKTARR
jgi:hypothetical protein